MLLLFAPYPHMNHIYDGVAARVLAIDEFVFDRERCYINISFTRFIKMKKYKKDKLEAIECNFFLYFVYIIFLVLKANTIYCHTMMNYLRALPFCWWKRNVIVDIHGVLVDELKYNKASMFKIILYGIVEKIIISKAKKVICVSKAMSNYYIDKYRMGRTDKFIVLPIFSRKYDKNKILAKDYGTNIAIYAGNLDKWQCIDDMLNISIKRNDKKYVYLVSDKSAFSNMVSHVNLSERGVDYYYDSVPKECVEGYYEKADFGFIIREDNIVNAVSCPTKLTEYICNGVIPIKNEYSLGDFSGIKYISVEKFVRNQIPTAEKLREIAIYNGSLYEKIYILAQEGRKELIRNLK